VSDEPETRPSLLVRIRDLGDRDAWDQFVGIYAPLIHGFARKKGLQEADAADVTQDILRQIARSIERFRYDQNRGSFRGWLFTLTRNRLTNFFSRDARTARGSGDTRVRAQLEELPDAAAERTEWDREYDRQLFACAVRRVQPRCKPKTWHGTCTASAPSCLPLVPDAHHFKGRRRWPC